MILNLELEGFFLGIFFKDLIFQLTKNFVKLILRIMIYYLYVGVLWGSMCFNLLEPNIVFSAFLHKNAENNYFDQRLRCVANAGRDIQHWLVDDYLWSG